MNNYVPHDTVAEEYVISQALRHLAFLPRYALLALSSNDFYQLKYGVVWDACKDIYCSQTMVPTYEDICCYLLDKSVPSDVVDSLKDLYLNAQEHNFLEFCRCILSIKIAATIRHKEFIGHGMDKVRSEDTGV